ncbi:hypothetical protein L596_010348 [Steinernema carpocapsae]|uniref:Uncharacterized protein n=1 Tax=Steinernema carpocapsae TaxID=34508 RepID=A0A4U5PI48_STECR|nr:hypothetical protein L596_010348 [Steinernema carpocapsae]
MFGDSLGSLFPQEEAAMDAANPPSEALKSDLNAKIRRVLAFGNSTDIFANARDFQDNARRLGKGRLRGRRPLAQTKRPLNGGEERSPRRLQPASGFKAALMQKMSRRMDKLCALPELLVLKEFRKHLNLKGVDVEEREANLWEELREAMEEHQEALESREKTKKLFEATLKAVKSAGLSEKRMEMIVKLENRNLL